MDKKLKCLYDILKKMGSVLVAYSGGVDSTFLIKVASMALPRDKVLAVTARSQTYPLREYKEAVRLAKTMKVRHLTIHTDELGIKGFRNNPVNRCYFCKGELFKTLNGIAQQQGIRYVADGANKDDLKDFRPGSLAAREYGVRSPLKEAGLGKDDIRKLSRKLALATWDKPSFACLASRFPYHNRITEDKLTVVEEAEEFIRGLGFSQVRVRHHGDIVRIEVIGNEIKRLTRDEEIRKKILKKFKRLGFTYVTVDLEGYRTGSMNESINQGSR